MYPRVSCFKIVKSAISKPTASLRTEPSLSSSYKLPELQIKPRSLLKSSSFHKPSLSKSDGDVKKHVTISPTLLTASSERKKKKHHRSAEDMCDTESETTTFRKTPRFAPQQNFDAHKYLLKSFDEEQMDMVRRLERMGSSTSGKYLHKPSGLSHSFSAEGKDEMQIDDMELN